MDTKLRLAELRQTIGDSIRSRHIPRWLLPIAKACYSELGHLAVAVVRPNDPIAIAAIARAETLIEVCGMAPPTGSHGIIGGPTPLPDTTPPRAPAGRQTILVIEDDVDVRLTIREMLEEKEYHVITIRDGAEALAVLQHVEPSLILLDLMMPRLNGWEFIKRVNVDRRWAEIPVCVMSAYANMRVPEKVVAALPKPINLDHLLAVVVAHSRPASL